ncbi:pSer/pThr/pTyr-binding forkhead associated (FHA) protein [Acidovorax soli]|uniref:PSer/pThr/pTyr-binding forkhead associated (FHA) protein n=1 Tax=Acidovorax soli TaxID=592050 RepID=A0A7X0P9X7_9BURK|nr:FHA domain-containing protein [Acidovorax soli]MBB6558020.1 pSer/pThr/pTyr-binding forkhead associated (FHA) protein [Acidovorax soli]
MPRMIVSIDGVVIKEVQLTKDRTTLGRRPYNDIVIDNLAVSGEHAIFHMVGHDVEIEDLGSTNGTYVNAKAVKRQELRNGDTVEVGKYKIRFLHEAEGENFEKTMIFKPGMVPPLGTASRPAGLPAAPAPAPMTAVIKVMSGAAAGREVSLLKVVTTIGKPGVAVASITKRHHGFVLAHVEGPDMPLLNGSAIGLSPVPLKHGDKLELAGTEMQFEQT